MGQSQSKKILVLELLEYSGYLSLYDLCILYNCSKNIPLNMIHYVFQNPNYIFDFFELNENIMIHLLKFVLNKYNPNINNLFNLNNYSILHIATKKKYNKSIKLLASSPYFDVNIAENRKGWTPLWIACRYGYVETLKTLLFIENSEKLESNKKQIIADVNKHSTYDITPLHIACSIGHVECVKTLLKIPNIDVNKADKVWDILYYTVMCTVVIDIIIIYYSMDIHLFIKPVRQVVSLYATFSSTGGLT